MAEDRTFHPQKHKRATLKHKHSQELVGLKGALKPQQVRAKELLKRNGDASAQILQCLQHAVEGLAVSHT